MQFSPETFKSLGIQKPEKSFSKETFQSLGIKKPKKTERQKGRQFVRHLPEGKEKALQKAKDLIHQGWSLKKAAQKVGLCENIVHYQLRIKTGLARSKQPKCKTDVDFHVFARIPKWTRKAFKDQCARERRTGSWVLSNILKAYYAEKDPNKKASTKTVETHLYHKPD